MRLTVSEMMNIISFDIIAWPLLTICLESLFKNEAISFEGREGALSDRSRRRKNLALVSWSMVNTDLVMKP